MAKGTTEVGYTNRNRQVVIRPTGLPGTDHSQKIYVLRCGDCGSEYGANGRLRSCVGIKTGSTRRALPPEYARLLDDERQLLTA